MVATRLARAQATSVGVPRTRLAQAITTCQVTTMARSLSDTSLTTISLRCTSIRALRKVAEVASEAIVVAEALASIRPVLATSRPRADPRDLTSLWMTITLVATVLVPDRSSREGISASTSMPSMLVATHTTTFEEDSQVQSRVMINVIEINPSL